MLRALALVAITGSAAAFLARSRRAPLIEGCYVVTRFVAPVGEQADQFARMGSCADFKGFVFVI